MLLGSINASGYDGSSKEDLLLSSSVEERSVSIGVEDSDDENSDGKVVDLVVKKKDSNTVKLYDKEESGCRYRGIRCMRCMESSLRPPLVCLFGSTKVCEDIEEEMCVSNTDGEGLLHRSGTCCGKCCYVCKCAIGCATVGTATYFSALWPFGCAGVTCWKIAVQSLFSSVTSWCTCRKSSQCCCTDIWVSTRLRCCQDCKGCWDEDMRLIAGSRRKVEVDWCYVCCC